MRTALRFGLVCACAVLFAGVAHAGYTGNRTIGVVIFVTGMACGTFWIIAVPLAVLFYAVRGIVRIRRRWVRGERP